MNWLNKLHGRSKEPAGLEWKLLRRMPRIFLIGTLLPILMVLALHLVPWSGTEREISANLSMAHFLAIGAVVVHWTVVLTVTIGCVIVLIMKGPAYVADAYPLDDVDHPAK